MMLLLFVLFSRACELCKMNVNVHMITLQLLVNQDKGHMIQMLVITDTSEYCHDPSVKILHLFKFQRCYANQNGGQSRLKIEKLPFWTNLKLWRTNCLRVILQHS